MGERMLDPVIGHLIGNLHDGPFPALEFAIGKCHDIRGHVLELFIEQGTVSVDGKRRSSGQAQ
jgi:hypothetical protein